MHEDHLIAAPAGAACGGAPRGRSTVYRCGNSYSQQPCAGGSGAEDARDAVTSGADRRDAAAAAAATPGWPTRWRRRG